MISWTRCPYYIAVFLSLALGCNRSQSVDEVIVYVAVDRKDAEPILNQFERESGIRVRAIYDAEAAKTTGLVTRLVAESKHPRCDVFWNNEIVQTLLLADRGLLEPYRSPLADGIPDRFRDATGRWTGIATRMRVITYNTKLVAPADAPQTLDDLCDSRWKGAVAIANPAFGTTRTHIAAMYTGRGAVETQSWLKQLLQNDVRIVDGNAMVKNLVARAKLGASPILVGLTDTDDVRSGQNDLEPIEMVYPDQEGLGAFEIPTTVCIIKNGPNHGSARALVDFLVSPIVEAELAAEGTGYAPVRERLSVSSNQPKTASVPYSDLLEQLGPSSEWVSKHFHH